MRKKIAILLALALAGGLFLHKVSYYEATSFSDITSASIRDKEDQIGAAQEERENLQNNLANIRSLRAQLEEKKNDLNNYVAELDAQLAEIEDSIARINAQIEKKEEEIALTQKELDEAKAREQDQYEAMVARIQRLYEQGEGDVRKSCWRIRRF